MKMERRISVVIVVVGRLVRCVLTIGHASAVV